MQCVFLSVKVHSLTQSITAYILVKLASETYFLFKDIILKEDFNIPSFDWIDSKMYFVHKSA